MGSYAGKREILVIDDDPSMLQLLVDVLSSDGFEVRSATNGILALQSVDARPPHLILADIHMPGMDGIEVLRKLKAQETSSDIPVIFVSGTAKRDERTKGLALGAVDFIPKPYQIHDLLARVHTHMEPGANRNGAGIDIRQKKVHNLHGIHDTDAFMRFS